MFAICNAFHVRFQTNMIGVTFGSWLAFEPDTPLVCSLYKYISGQIKTLLTKHQYHVASVQEITCVQATQKPAI